MDWKNGDHKGPDDQVICCSHVMDPNHRPYRYIIALLIACIQGVLAYTVELPAGLEATITSVMKMDHSHYSVVFSAYTWVDIVMSLIGSIIANKYMGIHKGFVVFMTIVMVGQLLCAVGCYLGSFWVFLFGRLIIGCGYGTTISILSAFQVIWFGGKEIAFVMSLGRMMSRSGATAALVTPQIIFDALSIVMPSPLTKLGSTQMVGTLVCFIGVLCALSVVGLDIYGAKMIGRQSSEKESGKFVNVLEMLKMPFSFWILAISMGLHYGVLIVFTAHTPLFFVSKYGINLYLANLANSLSYTATIFIAPLISLVIDFLGFSLIWAYIGLFFSITPSAIFLTAGNSFFFPFIGAVLISISYSFFGCSVWVSISLVVESDKITTAYGVTMSIYSLSTALVGVTTGVIVDYYGYFLMVSFNLICSFLLSNLLLLLFVSEIFSESPVLLGNSRTKKQ